MAGSWIILAEQAAWERLGERFRSTQEISWETWLGLASPILLIGLLLAIGKWWMDRGGAHAQNGPRALFRELAAAHRLSWYEAWLLKRLARASGLAHPVHVFFNPAVYKNREAARKLTRVWPRIVDLQKRLFGDQ